MSKPNIIVAVGGASGSIYAKQLLTKLKALREYLGKVGVVATTNAGINWYEEMGEEMDLSAFGFPVYSNSDFYAPFASGSAGYNIMIIIPCSMGLTGRVANGISNDLITRAADVILKERRRLIMVVRETPLSLIHINNFRTLTEGGAIICPASPSFYSRPQNIEELVNTVIDRVIDLAGIEHSTFRWGEEGDL